MIVRRNRSAPISYRLAGFFWLVQAGLLMLVLFPLLPGRLHVSVGDIASQTITAPRSFSYDSNVVRQRLQEEAAKAVKDVIAYDVNVRSSQLAGLDEAVSRVDQVRALEAMPAGSGSGVVRVEQTPLPAGVPGTVRSLTDAQWKATVVEARRVLGDVLQEPFTADEQEAKRASVPARVSPGLDQVERSVAVALVQPLVSATEKVDSAATEAQREKAIESVPPQFRHFAQDQDIVRQGEPIDDSDIEALRAAGLLSARLPVPDLLSLILVASSLALLLATYLLVFQPLSVAAYRRLLLLAISVASVALMAKLYFPIVMQDPHRRLYAVALPVALVPMLVASLFETSLAVLVAAVSAVLAAFTAIFIPQLAGYLGLTAVQLFQLLLAFLLSGLAGVFAVRSADRLSRYLTAAAAVAVASFAGTVGLWWLDALRRPSDLVVMALACLASGALASLLTVGSIVLIGPLFNLSTRLQLMELGQLNAPLLRRLQDEAPGTFHHSILVGNLAERAADLIGADSLLVRVGCYYHDIGKMSRPGFFVENQLNGESPHARLAPRASAQIIAEHVRYGEELARKHRLPDALRSFIAEHHGTRLVTYFYRKAAQTEPNVDAEGYAYPGPRPRSRETAIVMLADSIEATARAAAERSPERIDALVDEVIGERLAEGQLDECDLALKDLRTVADSFKASLRAIYHPRIEYPEPAPLEAVRRWRRAAGND